MKLTGAELRVAIAAYEAAIDPAKWKDVLSELAQHCGATKAALFTPVENATQRFLWCDIGFDPAQLAIYGNHWVKEDAWITAHEEQRLYAAGNVQIGSAYLPWDRLTRTAFYNEFAVPTGIKGLISTILFDEKDAAIAPRTHLSLFREPGEPEFERDHARFLRRVQPHLRKAVEVYWAFARARALPHAVRHTIDGLPEPVFVLRADGFIEHANPAARRVMSEPGLLRIKNGRLIGIAGNDRAWAVAMNQATSGGGGACHSRILEQMWSCPV
jgi:PAS domain-containing protein